MSTTKVVLCTPRSWWLLFPGLREEMGFCSLVWCSWWRRRSRMTFFITLPYCTGLVKGLWWVKQSSDTTADNGQRWLAGFPGAGVERHGILLTPYQNLHLCLLSEGAVLRNTMITLHGQSFSGWKGIHVHTGQVKKSSCLELALGTVWASATGSVSNGTGSEQWSRLPTGYRHRLACPLLAIFN